MKITLQPAILEWACERAGLNEAALAKKLTAKPTGAAVGGGWQPHLHALQKPIVARQCGVGLSDQGEQ
jgi:hypothetical protein